MWSNTADATTYSLTTFPGVSGFGINKNGDIVGAGTDSQGHEEAILVKGGTKKVIFLGHLFPPTRTGDIARAVAVNDSDQAVGFETNPTTLNDDPGLWQRGTATNLSPELGPIANFDIPQQATAINNHGAIVGFEAQQGTFPAKSWLLQNGSVTILPTLGGPNSEAFGINDNGQVVGISDVDSRSTITHAFVYKNGTVKDLGALPQGQIAGAFAINALGTIAVGFSTAQAGSFVDRHATIFENGTVVDLTPNINGHDAFANGIDASGLVVGCSAGRAFVWQNGAGTDLNTLIPANSGVTLISANGINDNGQIVVTGSTATGIAAMLLTPQ
jgi:probable HAF family extracellular repeat protein